MKERVIADISIVPIGTPGPSVSRYIAHCLEVLRAAPDVRHQLTPMGTVIEGPIERVLELARQLHEAPFALGAQRVLTTIRIDDRRDKLQSMEDKVASVTG